jgi:hypothetical protein
MIREEYLKSLTYSEAEKAYWQGRISADEWEWFCREWRNSTVRFSSLAESFEE